MVLAIPQSNAAAWCVFAGNRAVRRARKRLWFGNIVAITHPRVVVESAFWIFRRSLLRQGRDERPHHR